MSGPTRREFLSIGVGLASLAIGCRSEQSETPPEPAKREPAEGEVNLDPPTPGPLRPYRLDFRSAGGHAMASDGSLTVHEWTSWLRVRSDERVAELILTRHSGDLVDRPVGRFRHALDDAGLLELQQAIESTKWAALPKPLIGDPTTNWLTLDYVPGTGEPTIHHEFSASAHEFIAALGPLMDRLNASMTAPLANPIAALAVVAEAASGKSGPRRLTLRLRNVGTEPIVITDPRVPATLAEAGPRALLLVAAQPSGYQMPSWTTIDLPALPAGQPEVHVLAGGGELAISLDLNLSSPSGLRQNLSSPSLAGPCLLQAVWQDYAGPIRAEPDQLPFMALPESATSATGPYPVRGAAFSSYASFDA